MSISFEFGYEYIKGHFGGNIALGTQQMIQNRCRTNPKPIVDHIIDSLSLSGKERILDVGCGNGFILRDIVTRLRNGAEVIAVDISQAMLDLAKKSVNISWVPINFVLDDVTKMNVEEYGLFDRVMVNFLFHYIDEPASFIEKLKKLLHVNGKLIVSIEARSSMSKMYLLHFKGMEKANFPKEFIDVMPKNRRGSMVLENANNYLLKHFNRVVEIPYKDTLEFLNVEDYMDFYINGHGCCGLNSHSVPWLTDTMKDDLENFVRKSVESEISERGCFILEKSNSVIVCS